MLFIFLKIFLKASLNGPIPENDLKRIHSDTYCNVICFNKILLQKHYSIGMHFQLVLTKLLKNP